MIVEPTEFIFHGLNRGLQNSRSIKSPSAYGATRFVFESQFVEFGCEARPHPRLGHRRDRCADSDHHQSVGSGARPTGFFRRKDVLDGLGAVLRVAG